ncbi:MAG: ester cyclase [Burkholderiales bacterium]
MITPQKATVRLFYDEMWNKADKRRIPEIFHPDFRFRGSLGSELVGHDQFGGYVDDVVRALPDFVCKTLEMTEEDDRVVARMLFHGSHRGVLFGYAPTGKRVSWHGSAHFKFRHDKVEELWVLGDVHGLRQALQANATPMIPFATMPFRAAQTAAALDGSDVRVLLGLKDGGMAHFELAPGRISRAVTHRTVEEIWVCVSGCGEMWRRQGEREAVVRVEPGVCLTIPLGTHFQFRALGREPLGIVAVTMPPWPGDGEATVVPGRWQPSVPEEAAAPGRHS